MTALRSGDCSAMFVVSSCIFRFVLGLCEKEEIL